MCRCLYCYKQLGPDETDYHRTCAKKIFGTSKVPEIPYTRDNIKELAREIISSSTTVTGVQAKLSLDFARSTHNNPPRFTIVGLWGRFILKPQTDIYPHLPELEDLTMHMAEAAGIKTVPHSLIRFADGELCYITRRIDRTDTNDKIAMEDMCQLSERLTEDKYKGSYERIAKLILKYSSVPMLDTVNFWQVVIFSWLTGNADMHLKNFSLYRPADTYSLTPAYDLLSTVLVLPTDTEELALTLNGKKRKINYQDFRNPMLASGLNDKVIANLFRNFEKVLPEWGKLIDISFLPQEMKEAYKGLLESRIAIIKKEV